MSANRGRGGRRGRRGRGGRPPFVGRDALLVSRHEQLANIGILAGFTANTVPINLESFPGVEAIARQYTEYVFTRFVCRLTNGTTSTSQGFTYAAYTFVSPTQLTSDMLTISTMAGYRTSSSHDTNPIISRLPRGANQQRFYPVAQADLTPEQLNDPNVVQAWLIYGSNLTTNALLEVNLSYTIALRGPTHGNLQGIPSGRSLAVNMIVRGGITGVNTETHISDSEE